jgi:hypothetical protein
MDKYLKLVEIAKQYGVEDKLARKLVFEFLVELARTKIAEAETKADVLPEPKGLSINVTEEVNIKDVPR